MIRAFCEILISRGHWEPCHESACPPSKKDGYVEDFDLDCDNFQQISYSGWLIISVYCDQAGGNQDKA